uniref:1,4-alpha-D-glucan glucanohydrolase n=1 Tax=Kalanchoe fedtschenkoi TaxID=63787 RepID=A0A7N0ULS4_KALFE
MATVSLEPIVHRTRRDSSTFRGRKQRQSASFLDFGKSNRRLCNGGRLFSFRPRAGVVRASSNGATAVVEADEIVDVCFKESYPLRRTDAVEGKIFIRLDSGKDEGAWQLTVGCSLPGKWILHWGVNYEEDVGSEWDQPPVEMRPPESVIVKDYAIETPLKKLSSVAKEGPLYELTVNVIPNSGIAAINFVLKDEETGAWYQHRGRDFKVPLVASAVEGSNIVGASKRFDIWAGPLGQLSNILQKTEVTDSTTEGGQSVDTKRRARQLEGFYEEHSIVKESYVDNSLTVSVRECPQTFKHLVQVETDYTGDVVVHWGVCRDDTRSWKLPEGPYPPNTTPFKKKALRTLLQPKEGGNGSSGLFTLNADVMGFIFVLKLNENTWFRCMGNDFFVPLPSSEKKPLQAKPDWSEGPKDTSSEATMPEPARFTDGIINEIRNLVTDIASEKIRQAKTKEAQESILQEIEKLAAEAYSIFRTSTPTLVEEDAVLESEADQTAKICSGTGTGYEIVCQGFNWESHKSGKWYLELKQKAAELSSLGFTVMWLPPPTESVSPEGYMPKDLYNLNSRYGTIDELKDLVKRLHEVGIKVLGDAVLNHRCAHFQNKNGVWNIFGGRLNWDDRAIVADDPHFQGRGNKSSGDCFHAAPNIDHSQDFVRKDIKEWMCWLRKEVGYDGWRLDFVRGFWGGYVKDYMDASEPYFAVGEYWDSLSYTYGAMDHNQDAHRQRIVDWINATGGTAGAFDVTTKGILHAALEKCEYWRLSDEKGKPPGVLGWWPSRAVTFIENHDTGSTQGHWRFPGGKEMQGYAYILTHPGTPAVFYDHIFSNYQSEIGKLISLRNRKKIHCRSVVSIKYPFIIKHDCSCSLHV